jgi:hypothetical protein
MKIKTIRYENLKGRSGECELGDATFIHGRNFKGKTTILDAVKLALLGYHPALDRTAQGVFSLCSGDKLEVVAAMDNGTDVLQRQWRRSNGSVTKAAHLPLSWPDFPVAVLDADAYFAASDRGKSELLFKAVAAKQDPKFTMRTLDMVETNAGREIADRLAANVDARCHSPTNNEWLGAACTIIEEMRSEAAADVRRYAGTLQGLGAIRSGDLEPLDVDVEEKLTEAMRVFEDAIRAEADAVVKRKGETTELRGELEAETRRLRDRQQAVDALQARRRRVNEDWESLMENDLCPVCGSAAEAFKSGASLVRAGEIGGIDAEIAAAEEGLSAIRARIDKLNPKLGRRQVFHDKAVDAAEMRTAEAREAVSALERKRQRWANEQADKKRLAEARTEHEEAVRKEGRLKSAKAALLAAKSKAAESTFDPILKAADAFTRGIMPFRLSFNGAELGYWKGARFVSQVGVTPVNPAGKNWVPWRTFSGTEQLIAFAALQAALAATSPVKIVVTDELGRLDVENKGRFLRNVAAAIKGGVIDQWIGVDTQISRAEDVQGFALVEVE